MYVPPMGTDAVIWSPLCWEESASRSAGPESIMWVLATAPGNRIRKAKLSREGNAVDDRSEIRSRGPRKR